MATTTEQCCLKPRETISSDAHDTKKEQDEEEEELFEIDFEVCSSIPPPHYNWESYVTSTNNIALMANCLLPISDLSNAVPMVSKSRHAFPLTEKPGVLIFAESMAEDFLGLPSSLGAMSMILNWTATPRKSKNIKTKQRNWYLRTHDVLFFSRISLITKN